MKTTTILLIFLFGGFFTLFAFDYQMLSSDRVVMFQSGGFQAMKIDSVQIIENDSVFYPMKQILRQDNDCYTPYGISWLGEKVIVSKDWNLFVNGEDTIHIKTTAKLDESWICFVSNDCPIKATVSKHDLQEFLGVEDSVKIISFQAYEEDLQPTTLWNDKKLVISKNYGLIQGFDLIALFLEDNYDLSPDYFAIYTLAGISNPEIGVQNLMWFDVWDFQPGDELHIQSGSYDYGEHKINNSIVQYLSREDFPDKILYQIHIKENQYEGKFDDDSLVYYKEYNTIQEILPNDFFDKLPGEIVIDDDGMVASYAYDMFSIEGIIAKTPSYTSIYRDNDLDSCWNMPIFDFFGESYYYYKKGLGYYYEEEYDIASRSHKTLVYYKKGDIEWGKPLILETGINEIQMKSLVVYNLVNESLEINTEALSLPVQLELFDLTGKTLIQCELTSALQEIPLNHLPKGIYLYRLTQQGKIIDNGKIGK